MKQLITETISTVTLVDSLLQQAIVRAASDVHLEPISTGLRVRFRIDGMLYDQETVDISMAQQVISRLKVLAHLDITEKRIPQDGKFQLIFKNPIDFRVSSFPSLYGEKLVVRVLDRTMTAIQLDSLGFSSSMLTQYKELVSRSAGFFIVTGPTGSGKTTTLYATLAALNTTHKNIITLEDPVEYHVDGITQGQINPEVGFTFEKGMRSLLRQDPDILMVGEIRDKQTAHTAIQAALTGHIVVSTIHTTDALSVIVRLMDMGIEPYLINAAVSGIVAQRLARKICVSCRHPYEPSAIEKSSMDAWGVQIETLHKGKGCETCFFLGYKGRIGIFELLPMTHALRALIVRNPSFDALLEYKRTEKLQSLMNDGFSKVQRGIITLEECMRNLA